MSRLPCLTKDSEMSALGDGLLLNSRSGRNVRSDGVVDKHKQQDLPAFRLNTSLLYRTYFPLLYCHQSGSVILTLRILNLI